MKTFEWLTDVVRARTARESSPFYRRLYGMDDTEVSKSICTWEEWHKLPTFGKDDILLYTLPERIFPPWQNADTVLASSGTSGKPPAYSSRAYTSGYDYRYAYHDFVRPVLSSMPTPYQQDRIVREKGGRGIIALDPRRPQPSVRIAKAAGVDSMLVILHHIPLITPEMERCGLNTRIRFIEIAGETCSHSLLTYMQSKFPNATITSIYGSSDVETSPIGIPCRPLTSRHPTAIYHAGPHTYLELVDPQTGAARKPLAGTEGDLVITADAGETATFPLIRYRIGDTVRVVDADCPEHGTWSFEVLGRTAMDFLKIPGGVLRADEVARTLLKLGLPDSFELHRYETDTAGSLKTRIVLHLDPSVGDLASVAHNIARELRVGPRYTFAQGISDGMYAPLECVPLTPQETRGKTIRMVSH